MRAQLERAFLVFTLIVASAGLASAQTPFMTATVAKPSPTLGVVPAAASAANSWLGGQIGYKFGDSDEIGDNLLVAASVVHEIALDASRKFKLPVISNFSNLVTSMSTETAGDETEEQPDKLQELLMGSSGIRAGLYPYREIGGLTQTDFKLVIHGETSWKVNGFKKKDSDDVNYLNQLRLAAGFEAAMGVNGVSSKPLTISVTPVLTMFSAKEYLAIFDESKSRLKTLEVVAVLPIAAKTGVLFEYVRGDVNSFRAGIVVAAEK